MSQLLDPNLKGVMNRLSKLGVRALYAAGALLLILSALKGDHYWTDWDNEHTLFSFGSALTLFVAAEAALVCYFMTKFLKSRGVQPTSRPWLWLAASLAFAYAAYDDNNIVHERLGYSIARFDWINHLPISHRDGLVTLVYGIGALVFTVFFLRELRIVPRSIKYYLAGIFFYGLAQVVDVILPESWNGVYFPMGTESFCEYTAIVSFAAAFFVYMADRTRPVIVELVSKYGTRGSGSKVRSGEVTSESI